MIAFLAWLGSLAVVTVLFFLVSGMVDALLDGQDITSDDVYALGARTRPSDPK